MAWSRALILSKFIALAAHFSISLVLVGGALALMWFVWFPAPLFVTDGGGIGLKLLVLVDVVLGPLLTFIVFNPAKSRQAIAFDLACIAVLQFAAFGYGLFNIHSVRVQAVAFYEGKFHAVTADSFQQQEIDPASWQLLGPHAPYLVQVREPANDSEMTGVAAFGMTTDLLPQHLQFLYAPYTATAASRWSHGWTLDELRSQHPQVAEAAQTWLARQARAKTQVRFFRVSGFYASAVMVIDHQGYWLGGFAGDLPIKSAKKPD